MAVLTERVNQAEDGIFSGELDGEHSTGSRLCICLDCRIICPCLEFCP